MPYNLPYRPTCQNCYTPIGGGYYCKPCGIMQRTREKTLRLGKPTKTCAKCGKLFVSVRGRKTCVYCR